MDILIGNAFPLTLVRRSVRIDEKNLSELREIAMDANIHSFWGHQNSLDSAINYLDFNIKPRKGRLPVELNEDNYPVLDNVVFMDCWIVSPQYIDNYRPKIGKEVSVDSIIGWQVLKITWL